MAKVEIYTTMFCPFCYRAKKLLDQKGVAYVEHDISMSPKGRAAMHERAQGRTSVPQIFIGEDHIGGCDELYQLDQRGDLDPLLAG